MKKLHLSKSNRKILGVCGGISESIGIDADIIRLIFLFSILLGGMGILIYLALYLIFPTGIKQGDIIDAEVEEDDPEAAHRIRRSRSNMMIAGVCGGLANYLEWDVSLIRILFILISFAGGIGILFYLFFWFIFPLED